MLCIIPPSAMHCQHGRWHCMSGDCIVRENVCNGVADCPDASDEAKCKNVQCEGFLFQCQNSAQCLSRVKLCNGKVDCEDGTDEQQPECDREDFVYADNSQHNGALVNLMSIII